MGEKEIQVIKVAQELFTQQPDWVTFFREVLGVGGIVREAFPSPEALAQFEQSEEYNDTSMNKLCITKLLQMVESELVPTDSKLPVAIRA